MVPDGGTLPRTWPGPPARVSPACGQLCPSVLGVTQADGGRPSVGRRGGRGWRGFGGGGSVPIGAGCGPDIRVPGEGGRQGARPNEPRGGPAGHAAGPGAQERRGGAGRVEPGGFQGTRGPGAVRPEKRPQAVWWRRGAGAVAGPVSADLGLSGVCRPLAGSAWLSPGGSKSACFGHPVSCSPARPHGLAAAEVGPLHPALGVRHPGVPGGAEPVPGPRAAAAAALAEGDGGAGLALRPAGRGSLLR